MSDPIRTVVSEIAEDEAGLERQVAHMITRAERGEG